MRFPSTSRRFPAPALLGERATTVVTPAGNSVSVWSSALGRARERPLSELAGQRAGRLVVVSAHPDDETIGAGRLIAHWARTIGPVVSVVATAGEACVAHLGIEVRDLGARRLAEWRAAMVALGAEPLRCCDLADGQVEENTDILGAVLAELCRPGDVVIAPWRHDPHPDHMAAGRAAAGAARQSGASLVEYPVWMTFWTDPEILERTSYHVVRVAVSEEADAARSRALAQFRTQNQPLRSDLTPVVPAAMLEHHRSQFVLLPRGGPRD